MRGTKWYKCTTVGPRKVASLEGVASVLAAGSLKIKLHFSHLLILLVFKDVRQAVKKKRVYALGRGNIS